MPRALALLLLLLASAPARADEPAPPPATFGYDLDRGAFIRTRDGAWELNPYAMVQLQSVSDFLDGQADSTRFALHAAKLILHGHIVRPTVTYHFQINAGEGQVVAEDIYLRWDALPQLTLLAGQIEVPFNRQHITLEAYQQLVDRSLADRRFNLRRDIGAAVYLSTADHRYEATASAWNGMGPNATTADGSLLLAGRLAWNPFGPIEFREADLAHATRPRLSIAVAAAWDAHRAVTIGSARTPTDMHQVVQGVAELTLRWRGVSLTGEAHLRRMHRPDFTPMTDWGAFAQLGVFLVPRHFEVAARYCQLGGDLAPTDPFREVVGGANYYFHGHRFKAQADAGFTDTLDGTRDLRVRLQLEFFL